MLMRRSSLLLAVLAALSQPLGHAQSDASQLLIDQARYWQERGDIPRAVEAWEKLLRADANQREALYGLGQIAVRENRVAEGREYVQRLRSLGDDRRASLLEQEAALRSPESAERIAQAREAVRQDDIGTALDAYRGALGDREPVGPLALEYYQTLASRDGEWDKARAGLERLVRNDPDNAQARLALAEVLTYRESSRREGLAQLQQLARNPQVGQVASARWRAGLEWLGEPPRPSDAPLYEAYVSAYPDDARIRALRDASREAGKPVPPPTPAQLDPTSRALAAAFRSLESGRLDEAERQFRQILEQSPKQSEAVGGLGLVRLRQNRFAEAIPLLQQASQGGNARRWQQALNSARYWTLVHEAETLRRDAKLDAARERLEQAVRLDSREPAGQLALASIRLDQGEIEPAAASLRRLANQHPRNADIVQALVIALARQQRYTEALTWFERLPAANQESLGMGADLRLGQAQERARAAAQGNDLEAQRKALTDLLKLAPDDPWARLELARVELRQGNVSQAQQVASELLLSAPDDPEARRVSAIVTEEARLQELERAKERVQAAARRDDLVVQRQAQTDVVRLAPDDPWGYLELARIDLKMADPVQARQQASILLAALPDNAETQGVAAAITNESRAWELEQAQARASAATQSGNLDQQYQALTEVVRLNPTDPWVRLDLARVELGRGDGARARRIAGDLIAEQPDSADARQVGTLILEEVRSWELAQAQERVRTTAQSGDATARRQALDEALRLAPSDPWIRYELAQLELQRGDIAKARAWVDDPLQAQTENPEAFYVSAMVAAAVKDWQGSLQRLDAIPAARQTEAMRQLRQEASMQNLLAQARQQTLAGQLTTAQSTLRAAEQQANTPERLAAVAEGYAQAGNPARGLAIVRQQLRTTEQPSGSLLLQYAGLLAETSQDAELAIILDRLQGMNLSAQERKDLNGLQVAIAVRQADALRQRGDLAAAYDQLAPQLAAQPGDPALAAALARLYAAAGQSGQALALLQPIVEQQPNDVPLLLAAADAAMQSNDLRYADKVVQSALRQQPDSFDVQSTAARLYRAQGRTGDAIRALEASLALQRKAAAAGGAASGATPAARPVATNPFAGVVVPAQPGAAATPSTVIPGATLAPPAAPGAALPLPPLPPPVPTYGPGVPLAGAGPIPGTAMAMPQVAMQQSMADATQAYGYGYPQAPVAYQPYPAYMAEPAYPGYAAAPIAQNASAAPYPSYPATSGGYVATPVASLPGGGAASSLPAPILPPLPGSTAGQARATQAGLPALSASGVPMSPLERELQALRAERSGSAAGGLLFRQRDGESGLSRSATLQTPVEMLLPVGGGKVALRVTPVVIDAGSVPGDYNTSSRFGSGPAAALAEASGLVGRAGKQDDAGVGIALAYEGQNIQADIGSSPLGMQQTNILGGVTARANFANGMNAGVTVSRRAVTDSLLSFAGATDQRTGAKWGGVTSTGGRLDVGYDGTTWGAYGHAGWQALRGHNVVDNSRIEGSVGIYSHLSRDEDHEITVGLNVTGMGYDKNLRYYTYGHGGYFSPQRFLSLAVPVSWTQRQGNLRFGLSGSVGIQNFKEDSARYFPGDDAMQRDAQVAAQTAASRGLTNNPSAMYEGQTKTGVGYGVAAAMEYQLAPQWFVGGNVSADNARDYQEWQAGLYLRYQFAPSASAPPLPLKPLRSVYGP